MEEYCDECGGRCDGVHSVRPTEDVRKKQEVSKIIEIIVSLGLTKEVLKELEELVKGQAKEK